MASGGYLFMFGVCCAIFLYPLTYLRRYLRTKGRSARVAFVVSLPVILVGAVVVTYLQVEADVLNFLEDPYRGGGAAMGLLIVFFYVPVAAAIGASVGALSRGLFRD
jgi:hypothetical protein